MRYGSVCSGIEAATTAWHPLGWQASFVSEIEAFPRAVLQHRWPGIPLHGDFTTIQSGDYEPIELLVGGTPCQSFSVAGLRGGLDDERGNLALEYLRLADRLRPRWLVWENVPGVLSSAGGRDFGAILGGMVELGYGFAYRVLDAQFFGVAQRRRRVFVVGYLGDWRRAAAVLFERHSLSGHPAPRRQAREGTSVSPGLRARANSSHRADSQAFIPDVGYALNAHGGAHGGAHGRQDAESETLVATALRARDLSRGVDSDCTDTLIAHTLKGEGFDASEDGTGRGTPIVPVAQPIVIMERGRNGSPNLEYRQDGTANAILTPNGGRGGLGVGAIAFDLAQITSAANRTRVAAGLPASTLNAKGDMHVAFASTTETMYGVRHADAAQTHPDQALRALRDAVGEEAYSEWGLGVLASLWPPEVLRSEVHGRGVRRATDDRHELGDDAPSLAKAGPAGAVQRLWEAGCVGRAPQGWRPPQRLAVELGAHLSELSHQGASPARLMLGLWRTSEGLGLLREALSALQEAWRPAHREDQPARLTSAVRRLTPRECERLMGFPDDYTLIPWRKGEAPDGPRYKALGNSMAVPVMAWIGRRIEAVEAITTQRAAA